MIFLQSKASQYLFPFPLTSPFKNWHCLGWCTTWPKLCEIKKKFINPATWPKFMAHLGKFSDLALISEAFSWILSYFNRSCPVYQPNWHSYVSLSDFLTLSLSCRLYKLCPYRKWSKFPKLISGDAWPQAVTWCMSVLSEMCYRESV